MRSGGDCEVWRVSLQQAPRDLTQLASHLAPPERERAAAFLLPEPRRQFVVARAALRLLLAQRLGCAPGALRFVANAHGKPSLDPPSAWRFNVSHAGDLVLVALARDMEVGVDVEVHRPAQDLASLAASVMCPEDVRGWQAAAAVEGAAAFYRVWACKEAVAKAIGCGMAMDFRSLRIALAPGRCASIDALDAQWGPAGAWSLREVDIDSGYSAAVVARTDHLQVRRFDLAL